MTAKTENSEIPNVINKQIKKLKEDLEERGAVLCAVTICHPKTGNQQVVGYTPEGVVMHISQEYPVINYYGSEFNQGGMYSIGSFYSQKAADDARAKRKEKEKEDAQQRPMETEKKSFWKGLFK